MDRGTPGGRIPILNAEGKGRVQGRGRDRCRFCGSALRETFVDLGMSPLANSYRTEEDLARAEIFYPLHARVCSECFLVQVGEFEDPGRIFGEYAYFSSYSESWLEHARRFAEGAIRRFDLGSKSRVIEVASNDGYLLQYFVRAGIPVLGVEPAANVAKAAVARGVPTLVRFFGSVAARELLDGGGPADLWIGNNVLAHVPDLRDFVEGIRILLAADGVASLEFPHLMRLIDQGQFDTIYHEHFSYFSFLTVERVFAELGLRIFDVEELPTHGGSLRIFACREGEKARRRTPRVAELRQREIDRGLREMETYRAFSERVKRRKRDLLATLIELKNAGSTIVGYGAPAKGNTLLNYCGIGRDFLDYTVDRNPEKQGRYLPGTGIPIHDPSRIRETRPDCVMILPWNLREEIMAHLDHVRSWGGRFLVAIPEIEILG